MNKPTINPFGDMIVKEPRRREPAVAGLNESPLQVLFGQFDQLIAGAAPREQRKVGEAQLVTSEQPGYGKSHLIGRLFRELHGRATLVYIHPFQNAGTVFQSFMLAIVQEMHFPDRADSGPWNREQPTQLDYLAHSVLAHLVADLVEHGRDVRTDESERSEVVGRLRDDPLGAFQRGVAGPNWSEWMRENFERLLPLMEEALARRGLTLASPGAWLRILYAYAFHPFDAALRRTCLDWLVAQPLETEELKALGLRAAESVNPEIDPAEASQVCRTRAKELCQLGAFFRPFVFCFDQTEVYGHLPALARAFGLVIGRLIDEMPNHLTLVTSNQDPWMQRIAPKIETADLERFTRPPLTLQGLNRAQAEELVRLRMDALDVEPSRRSAMLDSDWLTQLFPTDSHELGTRVFLQRCKERWDRAATPSDPLPDLYREHRETLLASPKRHQFEPDTLQWVIEAAVDGVEGITVRHPGEKYFPVNWETPARLCYFGFIVGSHWKQWRSIAQAAVTRCRGQARPAKAIFFRTPEQTPIPNPAWTSAAEIEAAKEQYLQLIRLSVEDLADLYAAKELFADAAQGDITYTTVEVLAFLREQLAPWWARLRGPLHAKQQEVAVAAPSNGTNGASPLSADELNKKVREIVKQAHILSVEDVIAKIANHKVTAEDVLTACGFSPEIRIHTDPSATLLQWQAEG